MGFSRLVCGCIALGACYAPTTSSGAPCDLAVDNCPSGQVCTAMVSGSFCVTPGGAPDSMMADAAVIPVDGRPDSSGTGDLDGDGIPDISDNCPTVANPGQENEDGDAYGDACDPCPPFPDGPVPLDSDGDGVPDACDPNPMAAGDQIVRFEGFNNGIPTGWTAMGTISVSNGEAIATGTPAILSIGEPAVTRDHVWASVKLDTFPNMMTAIVGVVARHEPNTDNGIACQLVGQSGTTTSQKLRIFDSSPAGVGNVIDSPHVLAVGDPYILELDRDGTTYHCKGTNPIVEITGDATFVPTAPEVGFRVRNATARYQWIMVITSP